MTAADDVDDLPVTVEDVAANEALVSLSGTSDLIFSDGFESGDTSAWHAPSH